MNALACDMLRAVSLLTALRPWGVTRCEMVRKGSLFGGRPARVVRYRMAQGKRRNYRK